MSKLRAGQLDRTVTLLARGSSDFDGLKWQPGDYVPIGTRRASVMPERRKEQLEALGVTGKKVISVWLRFDSLTRTLTHKHGLLYEDDPYEIIADPLEIGRREGIELFAVSADFELKED